MGVTDTIPDDGPMNKGQEGIVSSLFTHWHNAKPIDDIKSKVNDTIIGRYCGCGIKLEKSQRMCGECVARTR